MKPSKARPISVRTLRVQPHDVFTYGGVWYVVVGSDGEKSIVRTLRAGRSKTSKIRTRRLQREYARAGEI